MEIKKIKIQDIVPNEGQISGLPSNPRQWTKDEMENLKKSLQETPELFEARGVIVYPKDGKYIVLGGNMRLSASKALKLKEVPCIVIPEETPVQKLKEIVIKDNGSFGEWDFDLLANEWDDLPLTDWGVPAWNTEEDEGVYLNSEAEEIQRKEREFQERMEAGEIGTDDPEYQEFLEKFKLKKTTDDCYTPELVYNAVADWVVEEFKVSKANFVRPFYPGGDYQNEKYKPSDIVVDNPPFSIMAEIVRFYVGKGIPFFLFAPHMTLFGYTDICTAIICGVSITYANGAQVPTSFITNLDISGMRVRNSPSLYNAVNKADQEVLKEMRRTLPKYVYDHHVITASFLNQLARLGIEFKIPRDESVIIEELDSQKESKKAIFGKGLLIGEDVFAEREKAEREKAEREKAEREKAEREKAEREKAERFELSEREKEIVRSLSRRNNKSE